MITDVYLVYNDIKMVNKLKDLNLSCSPFFHFIDECTTKGKKEAFKLKGHWGARETPFAICMDKKTPLKAFFSEASDVLEDLTKYLVSCDSEYL